MDYMSVQLAIVFQMLLCYLYIQSNGISPASVYTHCVYTEQTIESISLHDVSTPANKTLHYVPKFN